MHHPTEYHAMGDIASGQNGALTPLQARTVGLSDHQIRNRLTTGALSKAGKHVLRGTMSEPSPLGDLAALVLDCGPGAVASGASALALFGLDDFVVAPPFHVTLPRGRLVERPPHHVHTTLILPPDHRTLRHGIPTMTLPRALTDGAKQLSASRLATAYDSALRDRKTTEDLVHRQIASIRSRGRYGIPKLIDVIEGREATRGGHSWLERRFLEICASHGLPKPETQQVVTDSKSRLVRVDFRFPGTRLVVEVLGYRWHRGDRRQFSRDAERINALVRGGFVPLQFTYDHVTLEEDWVATEVAAGLIISV